MIKKEFLKNLLILSVAWAVWEGGILSLAGGSLQSPRFDASFPGHHGSPGAEECELYTLMNSH